MELVPKNETEFPRFVVKITSVCSAKLPRSNPKTSFWPAMKMVAESFRKLAFGWDGPKVSRWAKTVPSALSGWPPFSIAAR